MLELAPSFKWAPRFELAPLLRLKIWNKHPLQVSAPRPSPEKKNEVQYTVRYTRCIRYFAFIKFKIPNKMSTIPFQ